MSETGNIFEEFRKASPTEKLVIILVIFAVAGIALYWKSKTGQGTQGSQIGQGGPTTPTTPQSGIPTISSGTPVLPSGINPVYGPGGGVVAFQQGPTVNPPTTQPSGPSLTSAMTRGMWSQADTSGSAAVPIWKNPNANWAENIGGIALNQQVQIGQAVQGNYFGKTATYYPITYNGVTGYIGSWDLAPRTQYTANPPMAGLAPNTRGMFGLGLTNKGRTNQMGRGHSYTASLYGRRRT